jgi:predicted enzyme related to lactoylglutathione lyase
MIVTETFVVLCVADMARATAFYTRALGATVAFPSPAMRSDVNAGVRVGLFVDAAHAGGSSGLHFVVDDLAAACAQIERDGGRIVVAPREVAPGVVLADATDSEGNALALRAT